VALGEQLIHEVYQALRGGPGWGQTLLVITYDEHGGCYDHVPPPAGAIPPDKDAGEFGFDFTRFGLRVPAVLVSPLIAPGTVFRGRGGETPAGPHVHPEDRAAALGAAVADRAGRGRARLR
jgi:phospholipase C